MRKRVTAYRSKGKTWSAISNILGIPKATAHYYANPVTQKICQRHNRKYRKRCIECTHEISLAEFKQILKIAKDDKQIPLQIERLSRKIRTKTATMQRAYLIKELRDKRKLSFVKIGSMLNRHYTTIMHLYNYAKKNNK